MFKLCKLINQLFLRNAFSSHFRALKSKISLFNSNNGALPLKFCLTKLWQF